MKYAEAYKFILSHLSPRKPEPSKVSNEGYDPAIVPSHCTSFEQLIHCYHDQLHMTEGFQDTLSVMLALNVAVGLGDLPLWAYVIGPPSSGKTTLAECVAAAHPYCYSVSKMTGIFSGSRIGSKGKADDAGLVRKFQDKLVVMKDFTSVLKAPQLAQDAIYAALRELYDGSASVNYLNRVSFNYSGVRFGIIACVTDAIRATNQSELGERFLCVEIDSQWSTDGYMTRYTQESDIFIDRSMDNMLNSIVEVEKDNSQQMIEQKCLTFGFLNYLHKQRDDNPEVLAAIADSIRKDTYLKTLIKNLSQWAALARCNVERDRNQTLLYRPRAEKGSRLSKQLLKLSIALCIVFGISAPDDRVYRIVRKVALDTSISFNLEIMLELAHSRRGLTCGELANKLKISNSSISRYLNDMQELNMLSQSQVSVTGHGRPTIRYILEKDILDIATTLGFHHA